MHEIVKIAEKVALRWFQGKKQWKINVPIFAWKDAQLILFLIEKSFARSALLVSPQAETFRMIRPDCLGSFAIYRCVLSCLWSLWIFGNLANRASRQAVRPGLHAKRRHSICQGCFADKRQFQFCNIDSAISWGFLPKIVFQNFNKRICRFNDGGSLKIRTNILGRIGHVLT